MSMTTASNSGAAILRPEDVGNLLVRPALAASIAAQVSTVVHTASHEYRIPVITSDPTAGWFAEGAEITASDAGTTEVVVIPKKVAGLTIISRELAEDSTPEAAQVVGDGLARDIARKLDAAFFGNTTTNGPSGLGSLTTSTTAETGTAWADLDPFVAAIYKAEDQGATAGWFCANPADALELAQLKDQTGSNRPLLGTDPTMPTRRMIGGVPLLVSSAVTAGTVWAIPRGRVFLVVRSDARIEVDRSVYFTSDRVAVKATMRVGIGFPHPLAIVNTTHASA